MGAVYLLLHFKFTNGRRTIGGADAIIPDINWLNMNHTDRELNLYRLFLLSNAGRGQFDDLVGDHRGLAAVVYYNPIWQGVQFNEICQRDQTSLWSVRLVFNFDG